MATVPYIPEYITIHLGTPNSGAQNVTVSFPDYIKNVASSEIYPTWPESSLIANIYSQISYALNRIYLEYYRSRGYNFDITNSTQYDQAFTPGRNIFENISRLVDRIFRTYIRREGFLEPLAAEFCNGTTVTCDGLSQWGTVPLAEQGLVPYEILTYYYGDDISLVYNTPVAGIRSSYPGVPLQRGSRGDDVTVVQVELNRISQNYPAIPKVYPVDGIFGEGTERSVRQFQKIFNLAQDGIVGEGTWYKLVYLYVAVKRLAELESEGQQIFGLSLEYPDAVSEGDEGEKVTITQYFLSLLSDFYDTIPPIAVDGIFGPATKNAVIGFQKQFNLPETGVVNDATWEAMYNAVRGIAVTEQLYEGATDIQVEPYPGMELIEGMRSPAVRTLQQYLNTVSLTFSAVPPVNPSGVFGPNTRASVLAYQKQFGLPETGTVNETTWNSIAGTYYDILTAETPRIRQYPGFEMKQGDMDTNVGNTNTPRDYTGKPVKSLQEMLRQISFQNPAISSVVPDGIFGVQTTEAVFSFQVQAGLAQTGRVDYETFVQIVDAYDSAIEEVLLFEEICSDLDVGDVLRTDCTGDMTYMLQVMINSIAGRYGNLPTVPVSGTMDEETRSAVRSLQTLYGVEETGTADKHTWNLTIELYRSTGIILRP